jgi:hypothetical protein
MYLRLTGCTCDWNLIPTEFPIKLWEYIQMSASYNDFTSGVLIHNSYLEGIAKVGRMVWYSTVIHFLLFKLNIFLHS